MGSKGAQGCAEEVGVWLEQRGVVMRATDDGVDLGGESLPLQVGQSRLQQSCC